MRHILKTITILIISLSLVSCVSYKPILDPNEKYLQVGETGANQDIKTCTKEADEYLKKYKAARIAKETARKAVSGAVVGTVVGAIFGRTLRSSLVGTAIGAGVGAASGAFSSSTKGTLSQDEIKQRYITNCLAKQGYSILGWE